MYFKYNVFFQTIIRARSEKNILIIFLSDVGQRTTPAELPIAGDPYTEIALELVFPKGNPQFLLNGKTLQLLQPLDRDEEKISHIVFQVTKKIPRSEKKTQPQTNKNVY